MASIEIFFCYAREDEDLRKGLEKQLRALKRQGLIDFWHDREIAPGLEWESEIDKHLNTAQVILLLISPDFMDSDYCYSVEMKRAMQRHELGDARVIPIILRPVYWQGAPFGKLQALPADAKPVKSWGDLDEAFFNIAEGIRIVVEELKAFTLLHTLEGHSEAIWSLAFSPDGQTLVSGSNDRTIKIWNVPTGILLRTLTGNMSNVWSIALSPDGQTLISGSKESSIKVWNYLTGELLRSLDGHTGGVQSIVLSADGQTLVSASEDKTIKVWNPHTGDMLRTVAENDSTLWSIALSADGQTLVSGNEDKTIKV
ncbi:MAG TPA: TIR domain-containing protein, partial [Methylomirabilota bacterium]|nr:TIR domain-containing protein [Methylomirabilota bacterium]